MGTNKEIMIRREKVALLTVQRFTASQIAKVMKVTSRTIENDRQMHRKNWLLKFRQEPFEKELYKFSTRTDAECREFWKILQDTKDENIKVRCLEGLGRGGEREIKIKQSLGVIRQAPEKVELSGSLTVVKAQELLKQERERKKK